MSKVVPEEREGDLANGNAADDGIQVPAEEEIGDEMRSYIRGSINANTRQATVNVRHNNIYIYKYISEVSEVLYIYMKSVRKLGWTDNFIFITACGEIHRVSEETLSLSWIVGRIGRKATE